MYAKLFIHPDGLVQYHFGRRADSVHTAYSLCEVAEPYRAALQEKLDKLGAVPVERELPAWPFLADFVPQKAEAVRSACTGKAPF